MKNLSSPVACLCLIALPPWPAVGIRAHEQLVAPPLEPGMGALMRQLGVRDRGVPSPGICTDFKWNVTEQTDDVAKGSFSATCAGNLKLTGTAEASLSGSTIAWSAQGNATAPGLTSLCRSR